MKRILNLAIIILLILTLTSCSKVEINTDKKKEDKDNTNPPSFMTIIVPDDDMILLTKASHLGITILPIPENNQLDEKEITSNKLELEEYIKDNDIIVTIPEN